MLAPRVRLALLLVTLLAGFLAFAVFRVLDKDEVRAWVDSFGALAPVAYVPISAVLGAALVPGPVLAAVSGLLFGAAVGTVVTLASSVCGAVLALYIARAAGRPAVSELDSERLRTLEGFVERHAIATVAAQRLMPAVPDAPLSYGFGVLGVGVWQIAIGTAIGAAPRAFSYTAIGASIDDPGSPLAAAGVIGLVLTAVVGAEFARRAYRRRPG